MNTVDDSRDRVMEAVLAIVPSDGIEAAHQRDTVAWLSSGVDCCRIEKPDVPPKHLVAYFALVDPEEASMLLVDHRNARRWLPTGGHVEPGEDPADTVSRELREELGIAASPMTALSSNPLFVTHTTTVGRDSGHLDVSLWYVLAARSSTPLEPDELEFASARWWTFNEIDTTDVPFDPHLRRFARKLRADLPPIP